MKAGVFWDGLARSPQTGWWCLEGKVEFKVPYQHAAPAKRLRQGALATAYTLFPRALVQGTSWFSSRRKAVQQGYRILAARAFWSKLPTKAGVSCVNPG